MSRGARALGAVFVAFAVWMAILQHVEGDVFNKILLAPVLMVLAFALYCLASLVHGVLTFRTVPAEAKFLQKDIMEARADLKAKGLIAL